MKQPTLCPLLLMLVIILLLATPACGPNEKINQASIRVEKTLFQVVIPAFGALEAVKSTPIQVPSQLQDSQTLAWMSPENYEVKQGDVLVRFDSSVYNEKIQEESFNIAKLDLEISQARKQLETEKTDLLSQLIINSIETRLAEIYSARDITIYARNKIIEDQLDLGYLQEKNRHLQGKKSQLEKKTLAELELLELRKQTHQVMLTQHRQALDSLEIKAPHDGIFIYERNWRGEKPRVGMSVWAGYKLGKLPDLLQMEAQVYILESEAAGLKAGLLVTIILDSSPGQIFQARVTTIDTIAKPLEQDSPLKYFQVKATLEKTDPSIMRPGNQLKAFIFVHHQADVITVPNQALFFQEGQVFVNIDKNGDIEKRSVKIGNRSLTRTVITEGVAVGEIVLLSQPQAEGKES